MPKSAAVSGIYYAKKTADSDIAKIGWSGNVKRRMRQLKLKLVAVWECPAFEAEYLEKLVHFRLHGKRVGSEWFSASVEEFRAACEQGLETFVPRTPKARFSGEYTSIQPCSTRKQFASRSCA